MHDEPGNVGGAWTANSKMLFCSIFQELLERTKVVNAFDLARHLVTEM